MQFVYQIVFKKKKKNYGRVRFFGVICLTLFTMKIIIKKKKKANYIPLLHVYAFKININNV